MAVANLPHMLTTLATSTWAVGDRSRARVAAGLAIAIYAGHTRDQGTPYVQHPLAVVTVLRSELGVTQPETLLLGLLHDALEVEPSSEALVIHQLGAAFAERLRAMTPDHRLERRPKVPGDENRWRVKTAALPAEELLVRLADRIHNLRDLAASPNHERRRKFVQNLTDFQLPLAAAARCLSPHLEAAHTLLNAEYIHHQQEIRP